MILLDVLMPGIDGYRTAEMIRADPAIGMAPIMFLSARGDTADKVRAFRSGAEDYMVKPFDAAELLARVAKALDRQARELGASPTTQLPGADAIQAEIERRLARRRHDRRRLLPRSRQPQGVQRLLRLREGERGDPPDRRRDPLRRAALAAAPATSSATSPATTSCSSRAPTAPTRSAARSASASIT